MSNRPKWMPSRASLLAVAHNEALYADCDHAYAGEELEEVIREAALKAKIEAYDELRNELLDKLDVLHAETGK